MKKEKGIVFPLESEIIEMFEDACQKLDLILTEAKVEIKNLVMYEMTDGTRTSTNLKGWKAYYDGGIFCLRLIHLFKILGGKDLYINVIHSQHKMRVNYEDIYGGLKKLAGLYRDYTNTTNDIKWKFIGDYSEPLAPSAKTDGSDLRNHLRMLEGLSEKNKGLTVIFMLDYSTRWLAKQGYKDWEKLPEANVIVRHCKGYVNGDMWLHGKLDRNTFMYVQNGSASKNWTDKQLIYLITIALKSYLSNKGTHYSKRYIQGETERIKEEREDKLSMVHRLLEKPTSKRIIIFSPVCPEIYEF